jgi:tRNA1Val (adenine37-N6)-methyltransferase
MADFVFKQFVIRQDRSAMKVNTDGILLGAWADLEGSKRILDIGSGNGLITMMLAQRYTDAIITGVDIDAGSCEDAQENFENCSFKERITCVNQSIQDFARFSKEGFDHIVSNPPFFSGGTFSTNENKANVRHTIKLAHGDLINAVNKLLSPKGKLSVILPVIEGLRFIEFSERGQLNLLRKCEVYSRDSNPSERLLLTFGKEKISKVEASSIVIHDGQSNSYSDTYKELTGNFYL